jgi:hypothetical protein
MTGSEGFSPDGLHAASSVRARPRSPTRMIVALALIAFVIGAVLVAWLVSSGRIALERPWSTAQSAPVDPAAPAPAPSPAQVAAATSLDVQQGALEQRLAAMEQRLARIDLQAEAASGNAARAEGLLIAFATRRMVERGAPLGFLEDQLKLRFADAQPNAVETIVAFTHSPVTLDQLTAQLAALAPRVAEPPAEAISFERVRSELAGLFVIRRDSSPSPTPLARLERAQFSLRQGRVGEAIAQVEATPGADAAQGWLDAARRYQAVQRALDLIETTALLEPRKLQDGAGQRIEQPSPADAPLIAPLDPQPSL